MLLLLLSISLAVAAGTDTPYLTYPRPLDAEDKRSDYAIELLTLALKKSQSPYALKASEEPLVQKRALKLLIESQGIDVFWSMTSREREIELRPIRIPIYKGLIGWRIFLTARQQRPLPDGLTLTQLQSYQLVQGHDWPDSDILEANGFNVHRVDYYQGIFELLTKGRVDLFPRSVVEYGGELENYARSGVMLEANYMLCYPTASYFFVNKQNEFLARFIEEGLERAIDDGSFDELFYRYHHKLLKQAAVTQRKVFILNNPLLPASVPLARDELWFRPGCQFFATKPTHPR